MHASLTLTVLSSDEDTANLPERKRSQQVTWSVWPLKSANTIPLVECHNCEGRHYYSHLWYVPVHVRSRKWEKDGLIIIGYLDFIPSTRENVFLVLRVAALAHPLLVDFELECVVFVGAWPLSTAGDESWIHDSSCMHVHGRLINHIESLLCSQSSCLLDSLPHTTDITIIVDINFTYKTLIAGKHNYFNPT